MLSETVRDIAERLCEERKLAFHIRNRTTKEVLMSWPLLTLLTILSFSSNECRIKNCTPKVLCLTFGVQFNYQGSTFLKHSHCDENFFSSQWEYTLVRIGWNSSLLYRKRANSNSKPNMNGCLLPTIFTWLHPELFLEQWTEILRVDKSGFGGDIGYAFTFFQQFGSFL